MAKVTFIKPTLENVGYILKNLRKYDKLEAEMSRIDLNNPLQIIDLIEELHIGCIDKEPAALVGCNVFNDITLHFTCLGTDVLNKYPVILTKLAKSFINNRMAIYYPRQGIVPIHKDNRASILWIKRLGFKDSGWNFRGLNIYIRKINTGV